ncbi:coenzyme F420-0:L-glutamate ligase [Candidatus Gottesmanbacteria bacterium]|nr:coenzyme F420-0:L-glutamate ligase [Candidatus Gottesmanbacteria bacterium]
MIVTAYKTDKITAGARLFHILDQYLPKLAEEDIVVITSKIVSICQSRVVVNDGTTDKYALIRREADAVIEDEKLKRLGVILTIKDDILIPNAGIDESNGNGYFILWPKDIHKTTADIWQHLRKKHSLKHLGVIITDSHTTALRWGTTGMGLAWAGFEALNNYIGAPDIFGRKLRVTKASILDGLSAASVVSMGEGNEQTPLAVIGDVSFVTFQDRPPIKGEIAALRISLDEDIFSPLLTAAPWKQKKK